MNTKNRIKKLLTLAIVVMVWLGSVANADDLIAYWPLDEGTGDVAYDAIGDNDGQLVGDPIWILPGQVGDGALYFDGGNYVNCGIGVTTAPDLTVALWIKADGYAHQGPLACSPAGDYPDDPGWAVKMRLEGGVWFRIHGAEGGWDGGDLQIDEIVYEPDTWVHMAFTFDSVTREINGYINGELRGTNTVAGDRSVANTVDDLKFGSDAGAGGEFYSGMLDEVAIWDIALTAEEVLDVYDIGAFPDPNDPYVTIGPDMVTVSDLGVDLDPTVVNNDTEIPQRDLTYKWSADPDTGVVFTPNDGGDGSTSSVRNPTVTITNANPGDPNVVKLTFLANLEGRPPEKDVAKNMRIYLYSDACKAIIAAGQASPYDPGDVNLDCVTDLADLAISGAKWLDEYQSTGPAPKP